MTSTSSDTAKLCDRPDAEKDEYAIATPAAVSTDRISLSNVPQTATEEVPLCRVCHGESEPNNQLFHPCKCDGSIKFVHQECLIQWLKVARKAQPRCELCGELFHFQNIYAVDAPNALTIIDILQELFPRVISVAKILCKVLSSIFFWGVCLPIFTSWWMRICWCLVSASNPYMCADAAVNFNSDSLESWTASWYSGVVAICIIIAVSVLCFELAQIVCKELEVAEKNHRIRLLQRQLAANVAILERFEEENRIKECGRFAMADYESLRREWDDSKRHCNDWLSGSASFDPQSLPCVLNQLSIDRKFAPRIVDKLSAVCTYDDNKHLKMLLLNFQKLADIMENDPSAKSLFDGRFLNNSQSEMIELEDSSIESMICSERLTSLRNQLDGIHASIASTVDDKIDEIRSRFADDSENMTAEEIECAGRLMMARYYMQHERRISETQENSLTTPDPSSQFHDDSGPTCEAYAESNSLGVNEDLTMRRTPADEPYDLDASLGALDEVLLQTDSSKQNLEDWNLSHNFDDSNMESSSIHDVETGRSGIVSSRNSDAKVDDKHQDSAENEISESSQFLADNHIDNFISAADEHYEENQVQDALATQPLLNEQQQEDQVEELPDHNIVPNIEQAVVDHPRPLDAAQRQLLGDQVQEDEPHIVNNAAENAARIIAPRVVNERGQLQLGFSHLAVCCSYVALFIILAIVVPAALGRLLIFLTLSPNAVEEACRSVISHLLDHDANIMLLLKLFDYLDTLPTAVDNANLVLDDKSLVAEVLYGKFNAILEILVGFSVYALVALIGYFVYCFKYVASLDYGYSIVEVWSNQCQMIYHGMNTSVKAAILLVLYGVVTPVTMAALASRALTKALPQRASLQSDFDTTFILCMVVLFFVSHMIMGHVQYCAFELRQLIRRDMLVDILPEDNVWDHDPDHNNMFNIQDRLMRLSYSALLKKFIVNFCMFLPGAVIYMVVPLKFGHFFCLSSEPLKFRINHVVMDVQIPVEMVLSHVLIPLLIEKLHYRYVVRKGLTLFLSSVAIPLGLDWALHQEAFPELQPQLPTVPEEQGQQGNHDELVMEGNDNENGFVNSDQGEQARSNNDFESTLAEERTKYEIDKFSGECDAELTESTSKSIDATHMLKISSDEAGCINLHDAATEDETSHKVEADYHVEQCTGNKHSSGNHDEEVGGKSAPADNDTAVSFLLFEKSFSICYTLWIFFMVNAALASWVLHVPLLVGRVMLAAVKLPNNNDIFNYPTGLALCWACLFVVRFIVMDVMHNWNTPALVKALFKWGSIAAKVLAVGSVWLLIPPMLLGLLLESLCLIPIRTPLIETPQFPLLQCWAVGLILLKVWTRCVLSGVFGDIDMRIQLEHIVIRGFTQFDATHTMQSVVFPTILVLMDFFATPFFAARICTMFVSSYYWRTLIVRFSYHIYIALRLFAYYSMRFFDYLVRLHNEIRDSRYLIGTRLTNRI